MEQISFDNERIQNIALYFVQNTKKVGITKLCKLFYFFDMDVYKEIGFTATGLTYSAKERGPVPMSVWGEFQDKKSEKGYKYFDLERVIRREPQRSTRSEKDELFFIPQKGALFHSDYLSKKEIALLENIVKKYNESTGSEMSEKSHLVGTPWEQTWNAGNGDGARIDFDLEAKLYYDTDDMEYRQFIQDTVREFQTAVKAL